LRQRDWTDSGGAAMTVGAATRRCETGGLNIVAAA